jgi:hypothetical protein
MLPNALREADVFKSSADDLSDHRATTLVYLFKLVATTSFNFLDQLQKKTFFG